MYKINLFQDALLKTKSKDDITRKLMQRMKEKKGDDASPFTRTKSVSYKASIGRLSYYKVESKSANFHFTVTRHYRAQFGVTADKY